MWDESAIALQQAVEETESALRLAVSTLGDEHPGSVILARQSEALYEQLHREDGEDGEEEAATVGSLVVASARTITGGYDRGGYVSWAKAADDIRREARRPRRRRLSDGGNWLTQEAYDRLKSEFDYLSGQGRIDIAKKIEAAREEGDLREIGGYHAAKEEQGKQEDHILQLQSILENARVGQPPRTDGVIGPGMTVTVRYADDDEEVTFLLASHTVEILDAVPYRGA
jgi:hypothetical protein